MTVTKKIISIVGTVDIESGGGTTFNTTRLAAQLKTNLKMVVVLVVVRRRRIDACSSHTYPWGAETMH